MSISTLRLFGVVPKRQGEIQNPIVLKEYGVLVSPRAAYAHRSILEYLKLTGVGTAERNSAFWQSWQKVATASDFELLAEQIVHYISTYGLEAFGVDAVREGLVYIPAAAFVGHEPVALKLIDALEPEAIVERCFKMLQSGMALAQETLTDIVAALVECDYRITGDERVKNKEAQVWFYRLAGKLPQRGDELFRYLVFHFSEQTLVINNKDLREKIAAAGKALPELDEARLVVLAESFNRYRDLWMAMKKAHPSNREMVNRLTRLSKKFHKPMKPNVLNLLTSVDMPLSDVEAAAKGATVQQLVRAYNALALRAQAPSGSVCRIRNGKQWTSMGLPPQLKSEQYKPALLAEIKRRVNSTPIYVEPFVDYAFPTSEKSFIGNVPEGTILRFAVGKANLLIGVHWDDLNTDLDFRADSSEFSLGWNTRFRDDDRELMHSGDMTRAPQPYGATEWIYASRLSDTYTLKVNLYRGADFSKHFKLMVGMSPATPDGNQQIPPKDILWTADVPMTGNQMNIGLLYPEGKEICLMLGTSVTGNRNVGGYNKFNEVQQDVYLKRAASGLRLRDVFEIVEAPADGVPSFKLADVTKDSFLG